MLTEAQWVVLGPLVEACRPHAKVQPQHLQRTIGVNRAGFAGGFNP